MKYEVGRILTFNKSNWGFISYKKGILTAFNLEEKNKANFSVNKATFEKIYNVKKPKISQETLDFISDETKKQNDLLNKLKSGIKFIATDGKEYTVLTKNNNEIYCYNGNDILACKTEFIKSLTNEFNPDYLNHLITVTTMKEYNALTNEEKVQIAINEFKREFKGTNYEILEIGNIIKGEAFYHEKDAYYTLIGLQIKYNDHDSVSYKQSPMDIGFFPIYIGKIKNYYPDSFSLSNGGNNFNEHKYENGIGDNIVVDKILISKDKLKDVKFK